MLFRMAGIPLQVTGKEKLDELRRSCVIVANHASLLDSYVMVSTLPVATSFLAKSELREHFFSRLFMKRMEAEYVDRFDRLDSIESAKRARERLARGNPLLFFAEGTTSRTPGLLPFHMGAFVTSVKTGAPLVPVAISGTRSILRSGSWFPRWGHVHVVIGDVILPDQQMETWDAAKQLRDACRNFILAHSGEPDLGHERSTLRNNQPS